MTDNPKKKLIIANSSDEDSSISTDKSEPNMSEKKNISQSPSSKASSSSSTSSPVATRDTATSSSDNPLSSVRTNDTSSSVPSSSSSIPSTDKSSVLSISVKESDLEAEFKKIDCNKDNFFTPECNKFILKKELVERNKLAEIEDENQYLYPNMNDKEFNIKIATKKEFNDTKYDGTIYENIKEQADILANAEFELSPHQAFVKNYLSFQTPYSSLLLYHGLGSGKTCSAIGVCEEMRDYMKQMGITKRIIIVASENVQDNFKLQLFDERKLKQVNGIWSMRGCVGNKLLKEINPMNMPMPKEKVISQIKNLINTYYIFLGYVQFANYIIKTMNYEEEIKKKREKKDIKPGAKREKTKIEMLKDIKIELNSRVIRRLRNEFDNRLIVIDEVHNIRKTDDNENKKVAINLEYLVKAAENMRFLLLSATPMYNNYKEIVWLLNLMNTNDRRGRVEVRDIFDKNGNFKKNGEELLIRKATGYISFVRGENPYTFPYRIYPNEFAPKNTFSDIKYPEYQMNLKKIKHEDKKRILSLYLTKIGECDNCGKCQYCCYKYIIHNLRNKRFTITTKYGKTREMPSFENMESFGYTLLQTPLESLIISYPVPGLKDILEEIPQDRLSHEFSPSFDETLVKEEEEEEEEAAEPITKSKKPLLIVESSSSERKSAGEEEDEVSVKSDESLEPEDVEQLEVESETKSGENLSPLETTEQPVKKTGFDTKKGLIVELSSSDTNKSPTPLESLKTSSKSKSKSKSASLTPDSDDETLHDERDVLRKQLKKVTRPLIVETTSSEEKAKSNESKTSTTYSPNIEIVQRSHQGQATSGGENTTSSSDKRELFSIDPHQLTGKIGLERMMSFLDSKSPPVKGDFEYKSTTLKNYGKIFSREEIGNYSAKIKSVLDKIYNTDTDFVSNGVILIYSQYIDSGLIPMALALEEMGFTRYGQTGIKPLFKNRPSDVVDVRTMKPPTDKKNFMPARYTMITGDPRLSPNNDFEVKGLTGEDNKDGNKVKVVLISKAGSEGIDLKFIRQVHILEPWYNMNRIEQIIGRAVRNFSHKDLPFEQRNVEIFMYGTILDKNIEEAADLYVYRVAEYKAVQIGKVTRLLKETSVDCIINHDQSNFTQEIMSASLKVPIKQELSTGLILQNFKIGDAPFSPSCDYMASCNYNCRPDADIDETKLNEDTYDQNFIVMNSEKILQRIRMLFKEAFFYKKDSLLKSIRTPKEYPYVQIYSALTQLIEDENEFIVDKYGRNGRLINIGEYYLFQPIELKDKNISIFDRAVPIDYKHDMINFELKQNIVKPVIDKRNLNKIIIEEEENLFPEGKRIIDEMKINYDIANEFIKQTKVPRGDDNWYKHCGIVIKKMSKEYPNSKRYLIPFLVAHMIELLLFDDKMNVMNYIYSLDSIKQSTLEWFVKEYFENNTTTTRSFTVFITYKLNKRMIMILNENNKWIEATPEDQREIAASKDIKDFLAFNQTDYNKIVGFIGYEKGNANLSFKTKNMTSKRDTGARCDEATKAKNLSKLNEIVGEEKYTNESTKAVKDADGNIISEAVGNIELCVLEEFILRYFNAEQENNKKWFFTPEMAIYHKLYTVFV
jgi:hypothetical protein